MRDFQFARKMEFECVVQEPDENGVMKDVLAYPQAQIPEYQTKNSAGADFFCAEEVTIPSIWTSVFEVLGEVIKGNGLKNVEDTFKPTLVHTGIKAHMEEDEALELFNRSSHPGKLGLILANSVGVVDADYADNLDNDGEIMFAYFNFKPWSVTLKVGDRVGQGVFKKVLRPTKGLRVKDEERQGGFGSTN